MVAFESSAACCVGSVMLAPTALLVKEPLTAIEVTGIDVEPTGAAADAVNVCVVVPCVTRIESPETTFPLSPSGHGDRRESCR